MTCLLIEPDLEEWARWYPDGLGNSAFSSPAWQQMEAREAGPGWGLQWLRVSLPSGQLTLPVLTRTDRLGRKQLRFRPINVYTGVLEASSLDERTLAYVMAGICQPRHFHALWWAPPWTTTKPVPQSNGRMLGQLNERQPSTYVMSLRTSAEQYLSERVSSTYRRQARLNDKRGLELVASGHSDEDIDAYYQLYRATYDARAWIGEVHTRDMFATVARMNRGGELVLARHEGRLVGGGVLLYDHKAVYYLQGSIERSAKEVFPHVALYHRALHQAEQRGLEVIDLGGVPDGNDGLERFKRAWGAEPLPVRVFSWHCGPRTALRKAQAAVRSLWTRPLMSET